MTDQPDPAHQTPPPEGSPPTGQETGFLEKYQYWIIGALCGAVLIYEAVLWMGATTPSEQLGETGMMVFMEAAYEDKDELNRDLAALDAVGGRSDKDAAAFLYDTIYPKLYAAYQDALVKAPPAPLEDNYRLTVEMLQTAREHVPEICSLVLELDLDFASLPVDIPPAVLAQLNAAQKERFAAMARTIIAARKSPRPLKRSIPQAVAAYQMAFDRILEQQGKTALLSTAMSAEGTPQDSCALILLAAQAVEVVPDYQRPLILKGMMLAPFAQQ